MDSNHNFHFRLYLLVDEAILIVLSFSFPIGKVCEELLLRESFPEQKWFRVISCIMSTQFYSLSYHVQHEKYNLTLYTNLVPLNSETYNSSFTIMNYAPAGKSGLTSLEFVEFNSSVTLSQQYAILGKVAKEIGKVYEKSGDETLAQLAQGYYTMEEEAKHLSKLVEKQLPEYNKEISIMLATKPKIRQSSCNRFISNVHPPSLDMCLNVRPFPHFV